MRRVTSGAREFTPFLDNLRIVDESTRFGRSEERENRVFVRLREKRAWSANFASWVENASKFGDHWISDDLVELCTFSGELQRVVFGDFRVGVLVLFR